MPRGVRPNRLDEVNDVTAHSEATDEWVDPSDHRPERLIHDLRDPGCRRRRALAILALARQGHRPRDLAVWFDLTSRQIRNITKQAGDFAAALGFNDG